MDNIIKIGEVVSNNDEYGGFRIKVRIYGDDDYCTDKDLPLAFPLLPKMMHILPKVGEAVVVLCTHMKEPYGQRFYVGPLIHQPQFMDYDGFNEGALTMLNSGHDGYKLPSLDRNPDSIGAMPKKDEISLLSRGDTDLTLGENEIKLRCGVRLTNKTTKDIYFNETNPAYIKIKHHKHELDGTDHSSSSTTIVSDEINLISTASKQYFEINEKGDLITDENIEKIINEAHVLPYGDILVKFLELFKKAFNCHTHAYSGLPPVQEMNYIALNNFNLKDILSENVRIN